MELEDQIRYIEGYKRGREELLRIVQFEIEQLDIQLAALKDKLLDSILTQRLQFNPQTGRASHESA